MKIIDLLNKISNGEEVPNSFKYEDLIFKRHNDCGIAYYKDNDGDTLLDSIFGDLSNLNDEVEIIEEEKKIPEKIEEIENGDFLELPSTHDIMNKINEIIDYLESKGE